MTHKKLIDRSLANGWVSRRCAGVFLFVGCITWALTGCNLQSPGGSPIDRNIGLGSVVDRVNRQQEENAEASKFVVYEHEFEVNVPFKLPEDKEIGRKFKYDPSERVRGFRLNEDGESHVEQIAEAIIAQQLNQVVYQPMWDVIVERSTTSKRWDTRHRYPVHQNHELDEARRQTVVMALTGLGVLNADQIVVVAPAFAEGMEAQWSANTYMRSR